MTTPTLEIKNLKIAGFASEETTCFTATIYVNGERAFSANNDGYGGSNLYYPCGPNGKRLYQEVLAWVKTLPAIEYNGIQLDQDLDMVIGDLMAKAETQKRLAKWCKTKTVFQVPGDQPDEYRTIDRKFDGSVRAWILKKYPNATIFNEQL